MLLTYYNFYNGKTKTNRNVMSYLPNLISQPLYDPFKKLL